MNSNIVVKTNNLHNRRFFVLQSKHFRLLKHVNENVLCINKKPLIILTLGGYMFVSFI